MNNIWWWPVGFFIVAFIFALMQDVHEIFIVLMWIFITETVLAFLFVVYIVVKYNRNHKNGIQ